MFNLQSIKSATLTAAVIGTTIGLSILGGANASQAASLTIPLPLNSFTLTGNAIISSATPPIFTSDMISLEGDASATSSPSPFLDLTKIKPTTLHFNYAFLGGGNLSLSLKNITTGITTFTNFLNESSNGTLADFKLSDYITTPGWYSVTHKLEGGGSAHFNNFTLVVQDIPEPSLILGLFGLGMAAFTLKHKGKVNLLVESAS